MIPCQDYGGYRKFGYIRKDGKVHIGHDFNSPLDSYAHACFDGTVIFSNEVNGFGGTKTKGGVIILKHKICGKEYTSLYGHIKRFFAVRIPLEEGNPLGVISNYIVEGNNIPHLHFCIHEGGKKPPTPWGYIEVDLSKYKINGNYIVEDKIEGWINPLTFIMEHKNV